jgi:L-fuconolactonase
MVTETAITSWKADDFKSYLDIILECFGPGRVMIGSDWPVCTAAGSYSEVMKIVEDYIRGFSSAEKAAVLGGNAKKIYNLGE